MPEVLLSNDDVTVLGPPAIIDLQLDVGPQGTRGSKFFVGSGDPNTLTVDDELGGQTLLLNDLYVNVSPGSEYGYLYQFLAAPGGNTWEEVLRLNPTVFAKNYEVTFTSGSGTITVPIADITDLSAGSLTADNFNVQYSVIHDSPTACVINSVTKAGSNLNIVFEAVEYTGSWSDLAEQVVVHLYITIVEAGES